MSLMFGNFTYTELPYEFFSSGVVNTSEILPNNTCPPLPNLGYAQKITFGILIGIIVFCALAGNVLVCIAILTDRNLRKSSNFFYVSLACADALMAILVMTFAAANDMQGWLFGPTFCNIWMSSDVMGSTASILNICAISMDRYLHIRNPYHYSKIMSPKRTLLLICCLWLLSALISFLPIHLNWHAENAAATAHCEYKCLLELNSIYAIISSVISFYIPCICMITIYFKMYQYARKHVREIKKMNISVSTPGPDNLHSTYKLSDHKAAITLGVIMGTFLFCWMPYFTMNVLQVFVDIPYHLFIALTWLGYLNSMANPVIYPIFNKDFRIAFKRILTMGRYRGSSSQSHNGFKVRSNRLSDSEAADGARIVRTANGSPPTLTYEAAIALKSYHPLLKEPALESSEL